MADSITLFNLNLSPAFKRCQRTLAQWLEQRLDAGGAATVRGAVRELSATERANIKAWLAWLLYAARSNADAVLAARIERLGAWLGGGTATITGAQALPAGALHGSPSLPRSA